MVTGRARKDFEVWFCNEFGVVAWDNFDSFFANPEAMQFGVFQDFFDSKEIYITINSYPEEEETYYDWEVEFYTDEDEYAIYIADATENHRTRSEARKAAITKANEIYNETNR